MDGVPKSTFSLLIPIPFLVPQCTGIQQYKYTRCIWSVHRLGL
jgi:hypothetical protein